MCATSHQPPPLPPYKTRIWVLFIFWVRFTLLTFLANSAALGILSRYRRPGCIKSVAYTACLQHSTTSINGLRVRWKHSESVLLFSIRSFSSSCFVYTFWCGKCKHTFCRLPTFVKEMNFGLLRIQLNFSRIASSMENTWGKPNGWPSSTDCKTTH